MKDADKASRDVAMGYLTGGKYIATDGTEKIVDFTTTSVTDSAEGWSWDHKTKTLTLSGAVLVLRLRLDP